MPVLSHIEIRSIIAEGFSRLVAIRHDLHAHPQLGYEEWYANEVIRRELDDSGIPFEAGLAETGVVGWIVPGDGRASRRGAVGLRADMDALPIREATGLPYASKTTGLMHACGHDGHMAVMLGAARVLRRLKDHLPRPVKLIFQPAEEGGAGAKRMIEQGALSDSVGGCEVGALFGLHGIPHMSVGSFASRPGALMAATDNFSIKVHGRGGHGAMPHLGTDPIVAASAIVNALQSIVSRNVDPTDSAVVTVGAIRGGEAHNVIPSEVELVGTFRRLAEPTAEIIIGRIGRLSRGVAEAYGCEAEITISRGYPVTSNDAVLCAYSMRTAGEALGAPSVSEVPQPVMAGEDFSFYGAHVPASFGFLGVCPKGLDEYPGLHTPLYDFTDEAIGVGVELMCAWALGSGEL